MQRATLAATRAALAAEYEKAAFPFRDAWLTLRAVLSRANEEEWQTCREEARLARSEAPMELRALLGMVYPEEPAWSDDAARSLIENEDAPRWAQWGLLSSVSDPALAEPLIRCDICVAYGHIGVHAADVLLLTGEDAVPVLLEVFAMSARGRSTWRWASDSLVALSDALACVDAPDVRDALERASKHSDLAPALRAHRERFGA